MTEEERTHLIILGMVAKLPEEEREAVMRCYAQLKGIVDRSNAECRNSGNAALGLLGSEIAVAVSELAV